MSIGEVGHLIRAHQAQLALLRVHLKGPPSEASLCARAIDKSDIGKTSNSKFEDDT